MNHEDLKDWPKDPANGAYLCTKERPMPDKALGRWAHTGAHTIDSSSDYSESYACKDCGKHWQVELPE